MNPQKVFFDILKTSLYGRQFDNYGEKLSHHDYEELCLLASQQAVSGLVGHVLLTSNIGTKLEKERVLRLIGRVEIIRQQNVKMNAAVVSMCKGLDKEGIRYLVVKGQTFALQYPDTGLRQSGDIDFLIHPNDWERSKLYFEKNLEHKIELGHSFKHVEWQKDDIQYEMHRMLIDFSYSKHQAYWDNIVMNEVWATSYKVDLEGYHVPTLPPTYNVLYTFIHIFYHLINEGVGIRQFCDWLVLLKNSSDIDYDLLKQHLEGLGLQKAYCGLGAILTDYLGVPEEDFNFEISTDNHRKASALMENIIEYGNFGHNRRYVYSHGVLHGVQHLWHISSQARLFAHYAPMEAWYKIPHMFKWYCLKIWNK